MKQRKKLISLICAFCLVLCLGVFGVLAVTELNLNIGGEIKFSATGVKATISDGRLVTGTDTNALTNYAGVWQDPSDAETKLKGFAVTTQKASYDEELAKWSGLKLQFNEAGDSVYLYFTITNNSTDLTSLNVEISDNTDSITGANNVNTRILLPTIDPISSGITANVFIEFKVDSKLVDALLKGFAINIKLTRSSGAVGNVSSMTNASVTNTTDKKYTDVLYTLNNNGTASVVGVKDGATDIEILPYINYNGTDYTVTEISDREDGEGVFYSAASTLTSVRFPNSLTKIGNCAFQYCTKLASADIPDSVKSIGSCAFQYCIKLSSVVIPKGVTTISTFAFQAVSIKSIEIPKGVISIGNYAFQYCTKLASVNIPNSVTTIGEYAFQDCTGLSVIVMPDSVTTIGESVFQGCSNLKEVTLSSGLETIGSCAFMMCTSLEEIHIPSNVEKIGSAVFNFCSALKTITGMEGLKYIGMSAFTGAAIYTAIYDQFDDGEMVIFNNCLLGVKGDRSLLPENLVIPEGVKVTVEGCFAGTSIKSVVMPNSLEYLGVATFNGCSNLTSVTFSNNLKEIGSWCFNTAVFTTISLPGSIEKIYEGAFDDCQNLTTIYIDKTTMPELEESSIPSNVQVVLKNS